MLPGFIVGLVAEWLRRGLQILAPRFDSGRGLQKNGQRDGSNLQFIERMAFLEPMLANKPGLQFNGHETGDGDLILTDAGIRRDHGRISRRSCSPTAPEGWPAA